MVIEDPTEDVRGLYTAAMLAEFVRNSGLPADCDISTDQFELRYVNGSLKEHNNV